MKKCVFMISLAAVLLMTSCASKKELVACQEENKALQTNYQDTKEQLAVSSTRVSSLEEQIAELEARKDEEYTELESRYKALQEEAQRLVDFADTAEKASSIFTELRNVACGYMNMGEGYYAVLTADATRPVDLDRLDTIRNWLREETESDQCEVNINFVRTEEN